METIQLVAAYAIPVILAYLIGSVNSAIIVTKIIAGKDIRDYDSKNAGMTNVLRNFGKIPALITLIGDFGKGILAVILGRLLFTFITGYEIDASQNIQIIAYLSAAFAIIGHIFPLYYNFKGGKGILTTAGILVLLDPFVFLYAFSAFIVVLLISRYVSLSSISAAIACPISVLLINIYQQQSPQTTAFHTVFYFLTAILVIFMHRKNIKRLLKKEEPKIGKKVK